MIKDEYRNQVYSAVFENDFVFVRVKFLFLVDDIICPCYYTVYETIWYH